MLFVLSACKNSNNRDYDIEKIKDELQSFTQLKDTLLFSSYIDDDIKLDLPFKSIGSKVVVIKANVSDCDLCLDMIVNEILEQKMFNFIPIELWIEGNIEKSSIKYKEWFEIASKKILIRNITGIVNNMHTNNLGKPFIFLLDSENSRATSVFVPITGNISLLRGYLSIIKSRIKS